MVSWRNCKTSTEIFHSDHYQEQCLWPVNRLLSWLYALEFQQKMTCEAKKLIQKSYMSMNNINSIIRQQITDNLTTIECKKEVSCIFITRCDLYPIFSSPSWTRGWEKSNFWTSSRPARLFCNLLSWLGVIDSKKLDLISKIARESSGWNIVLHQVWNPLLDMTSHVIWSSV